jgi:hypothetical protein
MLFKKWVTILCKEVWFNHLCDSTIADMKTDVNKLTSINIKLMLSVPFFVMNNKQLL